jgi:hypothetical protein
VELERATGGVVNRSYVTNLRKGRIENPGMDKLSALTRRWAFPRSLVRGGAARHGSRSFGGTRRALDRVECLFEIARHPRTGEAYTSAGIARKNL